MLQSQTILKAQDNSGLKILKCIQITGSFKKRYGFFGDFLRVSVKRNSGSKAERRKGDLAFALLVQSRFKLKRQDGQQINFLKNFGLVTDNNLKINLTRLSIPLCVELRKKQFSKLLILASCII